MYLPIKNEVVSRETLEIEGVDLKAIEKRLEQSNKDIACFSRRNTDNELSCRMATMLSPAGNPLRQIRALYAKLQTNIDAVRVNAFEIIEKKLDIEELEFKTEFESPLSSRDSLKLEKLKADVVAATNPFINAVKEIDTIHGMIDEIKESYQIGELTPELAEAYEVRHHITSGFRNGYRDILATGRLGHGTMEYFEQYGIHPADALADLMEYAKKANDTVNCGSAVGISSFYDFLDAMYEKYSDCYKYSLGLVGIGGDRNAV